MTRIFSLSIPSTFNKEWEQILAYAAAHGVNVSYVIRRCMITSKSNPKSPLYEALEVPENATEEM